MTESTEEFFTPTERSVLSVMIVLFSLPGIWYWAFLSFVSLRPDLVYELLHHERGSRAVRSIQSIMSDLVWLTPVFAAMSFWALRKMWPALSRRSRIVHTVFVVATASVLVVGLFLILVLSTGNFR